MSTMTSPDVGELLHKKKRKKPRCKYGVKGKKRGGPCLSKKGAKMRRRRK